MILEFVEFVGESLIGKENLEKLFKMISRENVTKLEEHIGLQNFCDDQKDLEEITKNLLDKWFESELQRLDKKVADNRVKSVFEVLKPR